MLTVLAIIGLLLVMVTVSGSFSGGSSERTAADQAATLIDRARARALATGGFAAFAVAGPQAEDDAWKLAGVFDLEVDPESDDALFPYRAATGEEGEVTPVAPWTRLPGDIIAFGQANGAESVQSMVDAPAELSLPLSRRGDAVACKVLIFNNQGGVAYPVEKPLRVVRVGPGDGGGSEVALNRPELAEAMPAVMVERFTGRIRVQE